MTTDLSSEELIAAFAREHRLPSVAVALVAADGPVRTLAYGHADLDAETEASPSTVYRIGSITKTFTAASVLQLRDTGRLRLDDPLVEHIPEFAQVTNPFGPIEDVTVRRLLTHEAGVPVESTAFDWDERRFPSIDDIIAGFPETTLAVEPDGEVKYSNLGYQLLGEVIARSGGKPYRTYITEHLLEPLGMDSTAFELDGELAPRAARGHEPPAFSDRLQPSPDRLKATDADGGLCSSVEDVAKWLRLQFRTDVQLSGGDQVLSGPSLADMHRPRRVLNRDWTQAMGLGWRVYRREDGEIHIGHAGGTFGFTGMALFSPARGVGVVALTNGEGPTGKLAARLLRLEDLDRASTPTPGGAPDLPQPVPVPFGEFLGIYAWKDHSAPARVEWLRGRLVLSSFDERHGEQLSVLEPTDDPLVFVVHGGRGNGEPCTFRRGPTGHITGLAIGGWPLVKLVSAE
ncbi:MAG: serine hydrolase domain-containing protein [Actinomycetota bacterium]